VTEYRRTKIEGATYFFTVTCAKRHNNRILLEHIELLRSVIQKVKNRYPFKIDAIVILPEHLHCIWTLPSDDADYKTRWALIKAGFSREIPATERRSKSREK
jgi:putative transposase